MMLVRTLLLISATLILLTPTTLGDLTIYDIFEKEVVNETLTIPMENYNFVSFYISLTGKAQNRVTVSVYEVNSKLVNIYLFDEENFQLYKEGKTAGPIFSTKVVTTYSKVFIPERSGNYFLVIENNDPFRKTAHVKVVWKYGVAASDLIPEFVEAYPSEIFWGEKLYIDFKIKNFSPVKAGAHEVAIYLEGEDGKLYEIDRIQNEQILAEEAKTFSSEKVISKELPRGLYRIKIVADPKDQVEEHNETNNEVYGAKIFVKGETITPAKPPETKTTPGFELLLTLTALISIALLHWKRKI
ncbi:MAG: PGF-CTERM sorting domain-containing protein [Archaeoglobaceae archaeon]|nr:PGF-CTERM sorting domain-containing protein [Archaeoglobaceae archaeon]MDW8128166.1 CARDB domain-containing protein [Archaeoglobaceae archaeon]